MAVRVEPEKLQMTAHEMPPSQLLNPCHLYHHLVKVSLCLHWLDDMVAAEGQVTAELALLASRQKKFQAQVMVLVAGAYGEMEAVPETDTDRKKEARQVQVASLARMLGPKLAV